jgi:hypothetical protein
MEKPEMIDQGVWDAMIERLATQDEEIERLRAALDGLLEGLDSNRYENNGGEGLSNEEWEWRIDVARKALEE